MMSTGDLLYLRTQAEEAMPITVTIQTLSRETDGQGGYTEVWNDSYQGIPARLAEMSGREATLRNREGAVGDWVLTVAHDQAISAEDRVVYEGLEYEVTFVNDGRSWDTAKRCFLKRIS